MSIAGLARHQRLSSSGLFRQTFDGGVRFVGRFSVLWLRLADDGTLRVGVIASRRTFRRAVDRNRGKRLLREAFRLSRHRFAGKADVVLIARRRILEAKRQDVERELVYLAGKAGILAKAASGARTERAGQGTGGTRTRGEG